MVAASAVVSALALGYGVYEGERGDKARRTGLRDQKKAQKEAKSAALGQKRAAGEAQRKANQKQPDIMALLAANQSSTKSPATLLTGSSGTQQLGL